MLIFTKEADLKGYLSGLRSQGKTLGFVPTMGALQKGHVSLIERSRSQCDVTICSIFVNPTQFNDKSDLDRYPRMPEKDTKMLEEAHCDVLFMPPVDEMYKKGDTASFDFGHLDKILEGEHRPGHFNGVAQVVKRFLEIIEPDKTFFGSKDYQQVMIVKELVKQMKINTEVVACPILREHDGLAMSSRNALLSKSERERASLIPIFMNNARQIAMNNGIKAAKIYVNHEVNKFEDMKLDYYEICDPDTLQPLTTLPEKKTPVSLLAVFVGKIRLIDNLIL